MYWLKVECIEKVYHSRRFIEINGKSQKFQFVEWTMKNSLKNYEKQKLKSKNATNRRVLHLLNENIFRKRRPNIFFNT